MRPPRHAQITISRPVGVLAGPHTSAPPTPSGQHAKNSDGLVLTNQSTQQRLSLARDAVSAGAAAAAGGAAASYPQLKDALYAGAVAAETEVLCCGGPTDWIVAAATGGAIATLTAQEFVAAWEPRPGSEGQQLFQARALILAKRMRRRYVTAGGEVGDADSVLCQTFESTSPLQQWVMDGKTFEKEYECATSTKAAVLWARERAAATSAARVAGPVVRCMTEFLAHAESWDDFDTLAYMDSCEDPMPHLLVHAFERFDLNRKLGIPVDVVRAAGAAITAAYLPNPVRARGAASGARAASLRPAAAHSFTPRRTARTSCRRCSMSPASLGESRT